MHPDKCPCEKCLRGKVALWKAFAGKLILDSEVEDMFNRVFSSHFYHVPCITGIGPINYIEGGAFGWGR